MSPADISIVIPTLNEADSIGAAITSAKSAGAREVIVCDGGSRDATIELATAAGATTIVKSLPGRGIQLNSGSTFATGKMILFLHADNRLHVACLQQICDLSDPEWGAFRQYIDAAGFAYRAIEFGNALRAGIWRMPFGDQGIFVRRSLFKQQGGFAEVPLMEDVELSRKLRKHSRPALLRGPLTISARRWQQYGVIRQTLHNWKIQLAYASGIDPQRLRDWY